VQLARPKLHIGAVVGKVIRWLFAIVATLLGLEVGLANRTKGYQHYNIPA
jgi:hypothetical protein